MFTFEPTFQAFRWTQANNHFVNVDPERGIGFGSGGAWLSFQVSVAVVFARECCALCSLGQNYCVFPA